MKRVYLADSQSDERKAFRLILQDLKMQVVGEASDWPTALAKAPATRPDMLMYVCISFHALALDKEDRYRINPCKRRSAVFMHSRRYPLPSG
jgi:PleD family two-component response regulator